MTTFLKKIPQILPRVDGAKFFLILIAIASIIISSCNKSSVVGLDVLPSDDFLHVGCIDTTTLITKTVREDSLRTDVGIIITGNTLLGKYIDPVFGTSISSIYTQLRLPSNVSSTSFGTSPVCDSIVLSLIYAPTYYVKKERKSQTVNVYELLNSITTGSYYSNNSIINTGVDLANAYSFIPKPLDSVVVLSVKSKPQLRIPLNIAFGQNLLNNTGNLINNATFQSFMKGFYITTENTTGLNVNEGNIMDFLMAESKMTLYYHYKLNNTHDGLHDSLKYDFSFGDISRFTHFAHNYSAIDANLAMQLSPTPPLQNNTVFVQSMAGVKTRIEMPYLMNWVDSGAIAINKAELIIKIDPSSTYQLDTFAVPASLIVLGITDENLGYTIPDYFEGADYYGGTYNSDTKEYHFNIARYIQQVLDGKRENNGLYLQASNAQLNANRVVIGGGGSGSSYQMKLNITSTKLH